MSNVMELAALALPGSYQVNNSSDPNRPYWQTIMDVSMCDESTAADYDCDGGCVCTLHLAPGVDSDPGCPDAAVWHMSASDVATAQFRRILTEHRIRWFVVAEGQKIPRTSAMRGMWGYDVECSCGWQTHTGGGVKRYIRRLIEQHKADVAYIAHLENVTHITAS